MQDQHPLHSILRDYPQLVLFEIRLGAPSSNFFFRKKTRVKFAYIIEPCCIRCHPALTMGSTLRLDAGMVNVTSGFATSQSMLQINCCRRFCSCSTNLADLDM